MINTEQLRYNVELIDDCGDSLFATNVSIEEIKNFFKTNYVNPGLLSVVEQWVPQAQPGEKFSHLAGMENSGGYDVFVSRI